MADRRLEADKKVGQGREGSFVLDFFDLNF